MGDRAQRVPVRDGRDDLYDDETTRVVGTTSKGHPSRSSGYVEKNSEPDADGSSIRSEDRRGLHWIVGAHDVDTRDSRRNREVGSDSPLPSAATESVLIKDEEDRRESKNEKT